MNPSRALSWPICLQPTDVKLSIFKKTVDSLAGCRAIFAERGQYLYIRQVTFVGAELGREGITARVTTIETPGLCSGNHSYSFESDWADFSVNPSSWVSYRNKWWFFFDTSVVNRVVALVSNLSPGETYLDDWHTYPESPRSSSKLASSKFVSRSGPGPVYAELREFIKQQEHEYHERIDTD